MRKLPREKWWAVFPVVTTLLLVAALGWQLREMSAQQLISYVPANRWLAALAIVAAYLVKSLSIFFPIVVLYLAAGLLFDLPIALAVTLLGTAASFTLPWAIGRFAGTSAVRFLSERYPRLSPLLTMQRQSPGFFAYLLRVIGVIPYDLGSLLLGACSVSFWRGLAGSWLGLLPGILTNLLLAEQLEEGIRTGYLALMGGLTILSLLLAVWGKRHTNRQ